MLTFGTRTSKRRTSYSVRNRRERGQISLLSGLLERPIRLGFGMHLGTLPVDKLPAWIKVNHVELNGIAVQADIPCRGCGLIATAHINEKDAPLMVVPRELILSLENVWVMAKADRCLRDVLDSLGDYARVKSPYPFTISVPFCNTSYLLTWFRQREARSYCFCSYR